MKMIVKRFSSSNARVLLEKVIRKNYEKLPLWGSLSLVKLNAVQLKKNFSVYFFLENFEKCPEKNKNFQKNYYHGLLQWIFLQIPLKLIKLTCRSLSKQSFSKCSKQMYNVESFERYFSFCPRLTWQSHSCLIYFRLFDGIWWKGKDGFFPERLTNTAYCSTAWHNENNYERSYWITGKARFNLSLLFFLDFCWIFSFHNIGVISFALLCNILHFVS